MCLAKEELRSQVEALQKRVAELEESESQYRALLENMRDSGLVTNEAGGLVRVCGNAFGIFGMSKEEIKALHTIDRLLGNSMSPSQLLSTCDQVKDIALGIKDGQGRQRNLLIDVKRTGLRDGSVIYACRHNRRGGENLDSLRWAVAELSAVYAYVPIAVLLVDREQRIQKVNEYAADFAGRSPEDMIGLYGGEAVRCLNLMGDPEGCGFGHACEECRVRETVLKTFADGKSRKNVEAWLPFPRGQNAEYRCVLISTAYLRIDSEERVLVCAQDITERRQMEAELRESEERYRLLAENSSDVIYVLDIENQRYTYVSPSVERVLGYTVEEALSLEPEDVLTPESHRYQMETFERDLQEFADTLESTRILELEMVHKDGSLVCGEIHARLIRDNKGDPESIIGICRDITKRKKIERALKESEERYRILSEKSPLGMSLIDKDGSYRYVNPKFTEIFGYSLEEIPNGRDWFRKAFPDRRYRRQVISAWISDQKEHGIGEARPRTFAVRCKGGEEKTIRFMAVTMEKGDQLVTYEDVSEKQRLEAQLQQAQKMEAIGTLAGGVAHDFNNILMPILLHSERAMLDLPPDDPVQKNIQSIYKAGERAKELVAQILTFARRGVENRIPLKVSLNVKELLKFLRSTIPATIDIRYECNAEKDTVLADPAQMHQIVMNLCTNAVHAMREKGGVLRVRLVDEHLGPREIKGFVGLEPGHYLRLSVSDTGSGIAPDIIGKIFEPYFTTKGATEGTGLGLAVIHGIVKDYGGDIAVESEVGKGSTFHALLPIINEEGPRKTDPKSKIPRGSERVLFVDDEKVAVETIQPMLEKLGYKVTARTSSIEALEAFRHDPEAYDLVITDQTMPNMTGKELARELMSIRPNIPIILCTGFSEQINEKVAKEMGLGAFIMKPIVMREIAQTIREVLDS